MRHVGSTRWQTMDRWLRPLCRCDGLKDLAVVAALLAIFGSLAVRLAASSWAVRFFS